MHLLSIAIRTVRNPFTRTYSILKQNPIRNKRFLSDSLPSKPLYEVNTNVANDVILFKYENTKFFKVMNYFAIGQYIMWAYLGSFAFTTLRDAPVDPSKFTENTPWYRKINLGENKFRNGIGSLAIILGTGSLTLIWMFTLKSVKYLILHKGGKHISFVTYAPFGKTRLMKVPLNCVSAKNSRSLSPHYMPLKVKNTWFHYLLDMRGEFKNPLLFDSTAGLARNFK